MILELAGRAALALTLRVRRRGLVRRALLRVLDALRALLVAAGDPLVEYELEGRRIVLPLSHDLPITRRNLPDYGSNVARIARTAAEKYPDLTFVDIGANVGDTAALVRAWTDVPILCVEGNERFFSFLVRNARPIGGHIELEHAFVGAATESVRARVEEAKGSAHLVADATAPAVPTVRLQDVLERHPTFMATKMIKIDTDGHDCRIIRGSLGVLSELKPVLFFEYDPYWLEVAGDTGIDVFDALSGLGYEWAVFLEGIGEYLASVRLADSVAIEDLDQHFRRRAGTEYADVCVFHREDVDLWQTVRGSELAVAARGRT